MRVEAETVVTLQYSVTDQAGAVVDEGEQPLVYLHGGEDLFPRLQQALDGRAVGDSATVTLSPADAFGDYDKELVRVESRDAFPETVAQGMQFEGVSEDGATRPYTVIEVAEDRVVVDGNHPLAGMVLVFAMTVSELRPATAEESAARAARVH